MAVKRRPGQPIPVESNPQRVTDGLDLVEEGFCPWSVFCLVVGASGDPLELFVSKMLHQGNRV